MIFTMFLLLLDLILNLRHLHVPQVYGRRPARQLVHLPVLRLAIRGAVMSSQTTSATKQSRPFRNWGRRAQTAAHRERMGGKDVGSGPLVDDEEIFLDDMLQSDQKERGENGKRSAVDPNQCLRGRRNVY